MRSVKIGGLVLLGLGLVLGLCLLWSANYAGAVWLLTRKSEVWRHFIAGEISLPILQAWTWWSLPIMARLLRIATGGLAAEVAVLGGIGYLVVKTPWKLRAPEGGTRIATLGDLKRAGMLEGEPGKSMLLGTFKGRDVRYSGDSHFYVNGPSRSGKGRGFVMPNLLEWEGSAIVLDVKRENWRLTGAARAALGQNVFELAPGSERSHRWNPLDFVRPWPSRATDLQNLAASLIPVPERGEAFWAETARDLLAGVLGYVTDSPTMEGRRHLRSALRMFGQGPLFGVLSMILANEKDLNPFIIEAFRRHVGRDEKQRPSFEANVTTALKAWNNSLVASMTSASDFDIRELRRNPFSVFISAPVSDFGSVEPIIRLFIQQVHDVLLRNEPGPDEPHKVVLMLDEFYQFQRLPEIIDRAPLVAGYGFRIALIAQNIPQVDERYSRATREALLGNMDIKLVVAVGDKTTGEVVSGAIGKHYVERETWADARNAAPFAGRTRQGRWEETPLLTADQLQQLNDSKAVLTIRGHCSAVIDKLNFYSDARFQQRLKDVAKFQSNVSTPELPKLEEWELFEPPSDELRASLLAAGHFAPAWMTDRTIGGAVPPEIDRLAKAAFVDWQRFISAEAEPALTAGDGAAAAEIVRNLRLDPESCGSLRGSDSGWSRSKKI
jgi:type IV secretion system protein VirD4